jgi:hypothetical protein
LFCRPHVINQDESLDFDEKAVGLWSKADLIAGQATSAAEEQRGKPLCKKNMISRRRDYVHLNDEK